MYMHVGVDVEDVRAARLRRLATEQPKTNAENSTLKSRRNEVSPAVNRPAVISISSDKPTIRRRLNDKSEASKGNTDEAGVSGTGKRLDKSRLLNPSVERTEDCQVEPQLFNATAKPLASVDRVAAASVRATSPERCPVTTAVGASGMSCDQRVVADNFGVIETADVQEEVLASSPRKFPGTVCIFINKNALCHMLLS